MKLRFVVLLSGVLGCLVPVIFLAILTYLQSQDYEVSLGPSLASRTEDLMLCLWPSSILMMATDGAKSGLLPDLFLAAAVAINALLYSIIGTCLWLGRHKHKALFLLPVILLVAVLKFFHAV